MSSSRPPLGFIGAGLMGEPMAANLLPAGHEPVIWNRSRGKCASPALRGATVADDASNVFRRCETVILMLLDEQAADSVLQRPTSTFSLVVAGHTFFNMTTVSPAILEIGDRSPGDTAIYPADDLQAVLVHGNWTLSHKDGHPYQV
jgi:3-hydroxyisobutyrate dehydrogenase-like beta-hydroxyacid dehydrogenase